MSQIILDAGSGNTCRNDKAIVKRMIDEIRAIDTGKHEVIFKWQLFKQADDNIPLDREIFRRAYEYAAELGYRTTSSVFDKESLDFLLQFDVPFVKIANRRDLDWLKGEIPRKVPVCISHGDPEQMKNIQFRENNDTYLMCVSKYPATIEDYENVFGDSLKYASEFKFVGLSDHTTNFGLWYRYQPAIVEWHYGLPDSTGLDAGPFMRTPEMLKEVL